MVEPLLVVAQEEANHCIGTMILRKKTPMYGNSTASWVSKIYLDQKETPRQ